jgi:hypothetical protein
MLGSAREKEMAVLYVFDFAGKAELLKKLASTRGARAMPVHQ